MQCRRPDNERESRASSAKGVRELLRKRSPGKEFSKKQQESDGIEVVGLKFSLKVLLIVLSSVLPKSICVARLALLDTQRAQRSKRIILARTLDKTILPRTKNPFSLEICSLGLKCSFSIEKFNSGPGLVFLQPEGGSN